MLTMASPTSKTPKSGIAAIHDLGSKTQIRRGIFGGQEKYSQAITELEQALYEKMTRLKRKKEK